MTSVKQRNSMVDNKTLVVSAIYEQCWKYEMKLAQIVIIITYITSPSCKMLTFLSENK